MDFMEQESSQFIAMAVQLILIILGFLVVRRLLRSSGPLTHDEENPNSRVERGAPTPDEETIAEENLALNKQRVAQGEDTIALLRAIKENLEYRTPKN